MGLYLPIYREGHAIATKEISTLIEDIETLLVNGIDQNADIDSICNSFGNSLAGVIRTRLVREKREATLRMSNIGKPCVRQLHYEIHQPELGEPLRAETYLKFLYGDIIEELMLFLAELAGHEVTGRQDEQEIEGIKGHRDAVIDGMTCDVKSASSYSYKKFSQHDLVAANDAFGYLDQLQSYIHAGQEDEKVTVKDKGAFLVVDKTLGHFCLDVHNKSNFPIEELYKHRKNVISDKENIPDRAFEPVPYGSSGNLALGVNCSYCSFKAHCWPGLRTFLYSNKPVDLVEVKREPNVVELKKRIEID